MSDQPMLPLTEPPDPLRRFVPTEHEACIQSGDMHVHVRTNDLRLLRLAGAVGSGGCGVVQARWTIVSDVEMPPELGDPLVLNDERTSFIHFGRACFAVVDHEKKEITGFVSARISDDDWTRTVMPTVFEVLAERKG